MKKQISGTIIARYKSQRGEGIMNTVNGLDRDSLNFNLGGLHQKILQWGASLAGYGDVRPGLAKEFKHIPTAISLAIRHPPAESSIIRQNGVTAYTNQFPEVDNKLIVIQKKIVTYLRMQGWRALAIPPDTAQEDLRFIARLFPLFQHKTAATCAGLGWIGKSGLLINSRYGPRLSWATVLTDALLPVSEQPYLKGNCGSCRKCVDICPSGAIKDEEWTRQSTTQVKIDVSRCARQLEKNYQALGRYICGLCILACPLGKRGD
ncbi:4Fe-4S double cluster binding domain-containing protein [Thermincola ferriacetica]